MNTDNVLNLALVQYDIAWLNANKNFERIDALLKTQSFENTDAIILPETFSSGFAVEIEESGERYSDKEYGPALNWMLAKAKALNVIMAGSILVKTSDKKANRFFWVWPDGKFEYYDKKHLFNPAHENRYVTAGSERKIIQIKNFTLLPQVCYDLRFPVWNRNLGDYDVMVNVANWPVPRRDHWSSLLKARAIENLSYVIGVNRVGVDGKDNLYNGGTAAFAVYLKRV